jgi:hypothetical protein
MQCNRQQAATLKGVGGHLKGWPYSSRQAYDNPRTRKSAR